MPFPIHINIVDLVFKGMLIGMVASAPMGPVGILCVQRTLNKGRRYGFVTGIGAAVSDIIYAGITGFGMAFVMDFINNDQNKFYLQIIGSALLLGFGVYTWRSDPTKNMRQSGMQRGTIWYNTWTAFLVTFSNPLIIFLFMALFAQFAFVIPDHPFEMLVGFASIVGGALLWWYGLSWLVDKVRTLCCYRGDKSLLGDPHGASSDFIVVIIVKNQDEGAGFTVFRIKIYSVLPSPPECTVSVHDHG